jgi:hypothetical protein
MGKTFHPNLPPKYDEPFSWSPDFAYMTAKGFGCKNDTSPWCSRPDSESPDDYEDGQIVTEAIRQLTAIVEK